ncbi:hypothetical protein BCL76_110244 [Streptomyces sp. CG 926]|uniref:hypothetical protein n=1 Tax=Streptomyces sp. CG 926 TaxID=1882405 RepID=UPI000D799583|nr:hypothetical protein [Streptomyces sp. CG 926]PWK66758.1 hypothetical protein BCL76_110244 [Streptomyces sp. CG 926]
MQLRRALPLTVAALVLTTGCVTVSPVAPQDAPRAAPAAARTQARQPAPLALPLGPLPTSAEAASPATPSTEVRPAPSTVPEAEPAPVRAAAERPRRPRRAEAKPPRPRRPAGRVKTAAPAKPRPAPQRSYDMSALCKAAEGTVHPSIVALCH